MFFDLQEKLPAGYLEYLHELLPSFRSHYRSTFASTRLLLLFGIHCFVCCLFSKSLWDKPGFYFQSHFFKEDLKDFLKFNCLFIPWKEHLLVTDLGESYSILSKRKITELHVHQTKWCKLPQMIYLGCLLLIPC